MNSELLNEFLEACRHFSVGPNQPGAIATPNFTLHAVPAQTEDKQFTVYFTLIPRTPAGADVKLPITLKGTDGTTRMGILTSPRTLRFLNIEAQTWHMPLLKKSQLHGTGLAAKPLVGVSLAANEESGTGDKKQIKKQGTAIYHNITFNWTLYHSRDEGFFLVITCPLNVSDLSPASHLKVTLYYDDKANVHHAVLKKDRFNRLQAEFKLGKISLISDPIYHIEPFSPEQA
ncbi:hypothetical protein [Desulfobacula toluolica]|uniref:Uncharacterized protein n=1 Tax=Desulfobacula toluolica (strain DSM 7467 / Tol2) TaxID=651182 RepID=K0NCG1_DESTT|nr:hypothetical protein [Desulfobacula toluolica]CCK82169.1 uncharacterized protein TOL2_C40140 [Desulfobacula toluolica Tol2]